MLSALKKNKKQTKTKQKNQNTTHTHKNNSVSSVDTLCSAKMTLKKVANSCSRDCVTTESQIIHFSKRSIKQGSQVGTAKQAPRVYTEYPGAAILHRLSWHPTSLPFILIFTHLHKLQPLTTNARSLVTFSTSIFQCTVRRGKAEPETRPLSLLPPSLRTVAGMDWPVPVGTDPPQKKGDAEATEKTWHYCTPLAKTELWEF